jgi:hypothetical protein
MTDHPELDHLLARAVAIARDAAIGETAVEPVVVALPDDWVPVPLFIETDGDQRSPADLEREISAFLAVLGAGRWVRIGPAAFFGLPAEPDVIACTAAEGDHRATTLLRPLRDAAGIITALEDLTPSPGSP